MRASQVEIEAFVDQILGLLIQGYTNVNNIMRYDAQMESVAPEIRKEAGWEVMGKKKRQVESYIRKAREKLADIREKGRAHEVDLLLAQYDFLYSGLVNTGKLKEAGKILDGKARVIVPFTKNITGAVTVGSFDIPLNDEEKEAYKKRVAAIMGIKEETEA